MKKKKKSAGKERKKKKFLLWLVPLLVVLTAVIAVGLLWFLSPGRITPKKAIRDYYKAVEKEDASLLKDVSYPGSWQKHYVVGGQKLDLTSVIEDGFQYQSGASFSNLKILSTEKLSGDAVRAFQQGIQDIFGVSVPVSAVSRVTFRMSVDYKNGQVIQSNDTGEMVRYLYKVRGKWFFLSDTLLQVHLGLDE